MFRKLSVAVVSGLVASAVLTVSPQALAAGEEPSSRIVLRDAARDVWGGDSDAERPTVGAYRPADVRRAVVAHRSQTLVVRMRFADLRRVGEQVYVAEIRTPDGEFYAWVISEPGHRRGSSAFESDREGRCRDFTHKIAYAKDVVTMRIARTCLGNPDWVRVSMFNWLAIGGSLFAEDAEQFYMDNPHNPGFRPGYTPRLHRG